MEEEEEDCCPCFPPCFIEPSRPKPGPDAYEEFEASFNNSGLVIRVLKGSHIVESIDNGQAYINMDDDCNAIERQIPDKPCDSLTDVLKSKYFMEKKIKSRVPGKIINHPLIPKINANVKYAAQDSCCPEVFHLPFGKIQEHCNQKNNQIQVFKRQQGGQECTELVPLGFDDRRTCCVQVDPKILKETMQGNCMDTRKKGIEVCYKTCDDTDSDIFMIKLGSKKPSHSKKNQIEIELRTPKQAVQLSKPKVTTQTQINEAELDAALASCKKKGKKGKGKGKKGKGKGKKK